MRFGQSINSMQNIVLCAIVILNLLISNSSGQTTVLRRVRRPNLFDHALCRQLHNGLGIRSSAVFNRSASVCKTTCRVIDRRNSSLSFVEYNSPNNLRCGPRGVRCVEGVCQVSATAVVRVRPTRLSRRRTLPPKSVSSADSDTAVTGGSQLQVTEERDTEPTTRRTNRIQGPAAKLQFPDD